MYRNRFLRQLAHFDDTSHKLAWFISRRVSQTWHVVDVYYHAGGAWSAGRSVGKCVCLCVSVCVCVWLDPSASWPFGPLTCMLPVSHVTAKTHKLLPSFWKSSQYHCTFCAIFVSDSVCEDMTAACQSMLLCIALSKQYIVCRSRWTICLIAVRIYRPRPCQNNQTLYS